jgi:DNA-directed RNA polymerase specialized sigma subunit
MPKPKVDIETLKQKHGEKWTDHEIGKLFGASRQAVYQLRKRIGLKSVKGRYNRRDRAILRMRKEKRTIKEISEKYNLSESRTWTILKLSGTGLEKNILKWVQEV